MNDVQIFNNEQFGEVRTINEDGQIWFVAKDVCNVLGYRDAYSGTRRLEEDEKGTRLTSTPGGEQEMAIVNEYGLYNLVLGSRKKEAKQFKRWITHEVLPDIRKYGMYAEDEILDNPDLLIQVATRLKSEKEKNRKLEDKVKQDKPKVIFAEALETSSSSILVGELAKLLRQNGVETGQNRLFKTLREEGYLCKRGESHNLPTQKSMDMGLFEIKKRTINNADGSSRVTRTTKVTGKGQIYFINKLKG